MNKKRLLTGFLFSAVFAALTAMQILTMVYFGQVKSGMHEDEYYSYYSTNRTNGFYYPDREWVSTQDILREFVVEEGTGFDFANVKLSQSWDVHPPLYYYLLHIACSLSPNRFSKWQGLIVNLCAFALQQVLLACLVYAVCTMSGCSDGTCRRAALWAVALWGFSPAAISMVMFIRMYSWLTTLVLLSALLHVRLAGMILAKTDGQAKGRGALVFAAAGLTTLAGFLTHYYFLVYLAFEGIWMLFICACRRKPKTAFSYALVQTAALGLAVLHYPSCLSHIFRGYRGRQAQAELFNLQSLRERITFFTSVISRFVFGGVLWWLLAAAAVLLLVAMAARKRVIRHKGLLAGMLMVPAAGYFIITSKTALLLGDSSVRYVLAICPLLTAMLVMLLHMPQEMTRKNIVPVTRTLGAAAMVLLLGWGAMVVRPVIEWPASGSILFLYTEDAERSAIARSAGNVPVVVAFNDASPYNIWFLTDELMAHRRLFYLNQNNQEPVDGDVLFAAADGDDAGEEKSRAALLAYIARCDNALSTLRMLEQAVARSGSGTACAIQYGSEEMWDLYYITSLR